MEPLLSIKNLTVEIRKGTACFPAVNGLSLDLYPGEIRGIAGESGCGKSLTALSIMGLLPRAATARGSIRFTPEENQGRDLLDLGDDALCRVRGREISMIFQEPLSSLNPLMRIGEQIAEVLEIHEGKKRSLQNRGRIIELMESLGLENAESLMETYPHRLSGGMCQRVMIAMATLCGPRILIADEPTTALDRNTQEHILKLLERINRESGTSILFISHDLGVIRRVCHNAAVMYAGRIVEEGSAEEVFSRPAHEYTKGLLGSLPEGNPKGGRLRMIPGRVPSIEEAHTLGQGCAFAPRCAKAEERCRAVPPPEISVNKNHKTRCVLGAS